MTPSGTTWHLPTAVGVDEDNKSRGTGLRNPAALWGAAALRLACPIGELPLFRGDELLHDVVIGPGDAVDAVHDENDRHVGVVHGHQTLEQSNTTPAQNQERCKKRRSSTVRLVQPMRIASYMTFSSWLRPASAFGSGTDMFSRRAIPSI